MDRPALAAALIRELDQAYDQLNRGAFGTLADEWEERCTTLGQRVDIRMGAREMSGMAGLSTTMAPCWSRTEHGRLERVVGGDVSLAGGPLNRK